MDNFCKWIDENKIGWNVYVKSVTSVRTCYLILITDKGFTVDGLFLKTYAGCEFITYGVNEHIMKNIIASMVPAVYIGADFETLLSKISAVKDKYFDQE